MLRNLDGKWVMGHLLKKNKMLWNFGKFLFAIDSKVWFYKNVLAKTVHTEIHIFGHIEVNGAENVNFCVNSFGKYVLIKNKLKQVGRLLFLFAFVQKETYLVIILLMSKYTKNDWLRCSCCETNFQMRWLR